MIYCVTCGSCGISSAKNLKKKLVRPLELQLEETSTDKCPHFVVQKKIKKVKKKLVRVLEI
jgi:hypothetical protein